MLHTCGRSDADEARGHALHRADNRRFPQEDNVQGYPDQEAGSCADMGVEDRYGRADVGGQSAATVEARPSQPQEAGARQGHQDVVGREIVLVLLQPRPHLHSPKKMLFTVHAHAPTGFRVTKFLLHLQLQGVCLGGEIPVCVMYVCMHVCMYACMSVCMYVNVYSNYVWMHVCIFV